MNEELIKEIVKVKKRIEKLETELGQFTAFEDIFTEMVSKFFNQKFKGAEIAGSIIVWYEKGYIIVYHNRVGGDKIYYIDFSLKNLKEIANVDSVEEFFNKLKKYRCETK